MGQHIVRTKPATIFGECYYKYSGSRLSPNGIAEANSQIQGRHDESNEQKAINASRRKAHSVHQKDKTDELPFWNRVSDCRNIYRLEEHQNQN
jgi:hypothetical protein